MNKLERQLLREEAGDSEPVLCIRSNTRIDAGRWWRRTPMWLCIVDDELFMLAAARRRYIASIPLEDCEDSYYCHASGELVVEPSEGLTHNRFALTPGVALKLMRAMGLDEHTRDRQTAGVSSGSRDSVDLGLEDT